MKTAFAAIAAAMLLPCAASAQEVTLRIQHFLSPESAVPKYFIGPWAEKVEAESAGRIRVEIYPAMQLGGTPPALYDQIRDGVIDGGWALPAYTPGRFPEAEVFELPFMTDVSAEISSRALWDFYEAHMKERMSDLHVCAVHTHGPGVVHVKGPAPQTLEAFRGLKLRGPSRQAIELLDTLGAEPVGMPVPAFPEALSKGVVDGGVIPWEVVPSLKVEELTDGHAEVGGDRSLYNLTFVWALNTDTYDRLSDANRAVIDANCGAEASALAGQAMDKGDALARELVAEKGGEIVTLSDDVVAGLRAIGDRQVETWIEAAAAKGLDAQAMVDDARAMVAAHVGDGR